jgi:hypothetical protein
MLASINSLCLTDPPRRLASRQSLMSRLIQASRLFTYPLRKIGNYHRLEPMAGRFSEP